MIISQDHIEALIDSPLKLAVIRQLATGGILTERRLAHYAGFSHVSVSRVLEECERFHLAISKRIGKANSWSINKKSYAFKVLEPLLNMMDQIPSPYESLKDLIQSALNNKIVEQAILYSSITEGSEKDGSDIDLCLILASGIRKTERLVEEKIERLTSDCYQMFGKRLSPYLLTKREWRQKKKSPIGQSILKGEIVSL